jgi:hypothetical protein
MSIVMGPIAVKSGDMIIGSDAVHLAGSSFFLEFAGEK